MGAQKKKKKLGNVMRKSQNTPKKSMKKPELIALFEKMNEKKVKEREKENNKEEKDTEKEKRSQKESKVKEMKKLFESRDIDIQFPPPTQISEKSSKKGRKKREKREEKEEKSIPKHGQKLIDLYLESNSKRLVKPSPGKRKRDEVFSNDFDENELQTPKKIALGEVTI